LGGNFGIFWVLTNEVFSEMGFADRTKKNSLNFFFFNKKKKKKNIEKSKWQRKGFE
jgi:hypothetical protein